MLYSDMYDKFSKYVIYTIIDLLWYSGLQNEVGIWFGDPMSEADADANANANAKEQTFLMLSAGQWHVR